jgi:F0F1-type ATP synthase membrane subunit b/b'
VVGAGLSWLVTDLKGEAHDLRREISDTQKSIAKEIADNRVQMGKEVSDTRIQVVKEISETRIQVTQAVGAYKRKRPRLMRNWTI